MTARTAARSAASSDERTGRRQLTSPTTPLMTSSRPTAVSPLTAKTWACRPTHAFARARRPCRRDDEAGERDLEQPEHDQVEADNEQHGHRRRVVQLVDVIEAG